MKKLLILLAAGALCACGDEYDDRQLTERVDRLEGRIVRLEELCKQMNTNISSLQTIVTALQGNDYVTGVTPVMNNGAIIGYTIAFTKSAPVTIYHGADGKDGLDGSDGKDGKDGKDGRTPVVGVRQDADGLYYWTLDGDWLLDGSGAKIRAEGRDGKDGAPGADGEDGADGQPGAPGKDGKDGVTPQLKIENGYWYVSTDDGATWTNLGKATGEDGKDGANGSDGKDGDSMFRSVTQDDENVYFMLADGETIVLPKRPQLAITFAEGDEFFFDVDETITVRYTQQVCRKGRDAEPRRRLHPPHDTHERHTRHDRHHGRHPDREQRNRFGFGRQADDHGGDCRNDQAPFRGERHHGQNARHTGLADCRLRQDNHYRTDHHRQSEQFGHLDTEQSSQSRHSRHGECQSGGTSRKCIQRAHITNRHQTTENFKNY